MGDIAGMIDTEWTEYNDEMWERRHMLAIIPDLAGGSSKEYTNRACIVAGIQNRTGAYDVLELGEHLEGEY